MSIDQLKKEVKQIEDDLAKKVVIAEEKLISIKNLLIDPAKNWIDEQVNRQIEKKSEVVINISMDELSRFKSNVNDLKERLVSLFDKEFSDPNRYPHNEKIEGEEESYNSRHYDFINEAFRKVVSNLGGLLSTFDLMDPAIYVHSIWQNIGQNEYRYSVNLGLDKYPEIGAPAYRNDCIEIKNIKRRLLKKQRELSEAIAKDKWENA